MNLTRPSSIEGGEGLWPDPLIPRVDRYANEARNAFPFTVQRGRNQPLWVEIFVPVTAHPGKYTGSARISLGGTVQFSVPINLTVWRFTLPSTSTLKSSFGLNGINALKQHRGRYTNDEDLHSITGVYTKAALLHRISTNGGSMQTPKFSYAAGKMQLDWRDYDAEVGPFLDGVAIPEGRAAARRAGNFGGDSHAQSLRNRGAGEVVLDGMGQALPAKRLERPAVPLPVG